MIVSQNDYGCKVDDSDGESKADDSDGESKNRPVATNWDSFLLGRACPKPC